MSDVSRCFLVDPARDACIWFPPEVGSWNEEMETKAWSGPRPVVGANRMPPPGSWVVRKPPWVPGRGAGPAEWAGRQPRKQGQVIPLAKPPEKPIL